MNIKKRLLSLLLTLLMITSSIPLSFMTVYATSYITNPSSVDGSDYTTSLSLADVLNSVFKGDIDIYSNSSCTKEVSMPIGSNMSNSKKYYVKSKTTGSSVAGWQCYIYANAVYNKLFNEWVGNGKSLSHSKIVISGGSNKASYSMFNNAGVRCGAYIRTTGNSDGSYSSSVAHSMIILSYNSSSITYLEGNGDGKGAIRIAKKTWSEFNKGQLSGRSRYICHIIQPTDSYYNSLFPFTVQSNKYSFNFNASGGTLGSTGAFTVSYGKDFQILNTTCTRAGYEWNGWNVKRNNDNTWYVAGHGWCTDSQISSNGYTKKVYSNYQTCTLDSSWIKGLSGDGSYTFYATWRKSTYTISYNANGGSGAPSSQTKTYGDTLTLSSTIPNRTGYAFLGWSTNSTATSAMYSAGGSYTSNSNATLYAVWSGNKYTVSYNANGGNNAPSSQTKYYGQGLTLTSDKPKGKTYTVTFNGNGGTVAASSQTYTQRFKEWNTKSDGTGTSYLSGGTYSANASMTLYAQWDRSTLSVKNPTRTNYYFVGWYDSKEVDSQTLKPLGKLYTNTTPITSNVTLYAMWSQSVDLLVFFGDYNLDGELDFIHDCVGFNNVIAGRVKYTDGDIFRGDVDADGDLDADDITMINQARSGQINQYTMPCYYGVSGSVKELPVKTTYQYGEALDTTGLVLQAKFYSGAKHLIGSELVVSGYDPYKTGSQTLTVSYYTVSARFTVYVEAPKYSVYYDVNGGFETSGGKTVTYGKPIGTLAVPEREGYRFLGWTYNKNDSNYITASTVYTYRSNKTLYAQWALNTYTVSYDTQGGDDIPNSSTVKYLNNYTIDTAHIPSKLGYTFCGYSTNKSSIVAEYVPGDTLTVTNNIVLYAVWANAKELQIDTSTIDKPKFSDQSLVYKFNPSENGNYVLYSECGYDISCKIYDGLSLIECADDDTSNDFYHLFNLSEGKTYYFSVKLSNGMIDDFVLTLERVPDDCYVDFIDPLSSDGENNFVSVNKNDTIELPSLSHTGYTFRGWSFNEDGSGQIYAEGTSIKITSSITVYAVWERKNIVLLGDVNGDGEIDAADAGLISRYDAGLIALTADQLKAGDVNKDGEVDAADAGLISRYDAGFISTLE